MSTTSNDKALSQTEPPGRVRGIRVGWWIAGAVISGYFGLWLFRGPVVPARLHRVVDEMSSVKYFYRVPRASHDGRRITYACNTAKGVGVMLAGWTADTEKLVLDMDEATYHPGRFDLWPWSPDDQVFILTRQAGMEDRQEILVCRGEDGSVAATVPVDGLVFDLVWLRPDRFVYRNDDNSVFVVTRQGGGWTADGGRALFESAHNPQRFRGMFWEPNVTDERRGNPIVAVSSNTIAWPNGGGIWTLNLDSGAKQLVTETGLKAMHWLDYAPPTQQYLFTAQMPGGRAAWRCSASERPVDLSRAPENPSMARWIQQGRGWAYLDRGALAIGFSETEEPRRLFGKGSLGDRLEVSPDGKQVFVIGAMTNEPSSIWAFTAADGELRRAVAGQRRPFVDTQLVRSSDGGASAGTNGSVHFQLFPPINYQRGRTYPVVLDVMIESRWSFLPQLVANAGFYYVGIGTPSGNTPAELDTAVSQIVAVREYLAKNPNLDVRRAYLLGTSRFGRPVEAAVRRRPQLWKGAIFLNSAPSLEGLLRPGQPGPDLLIVRGGAEGWRPEIARKFEERAAAVGIRADVVLVEGASHVFRGMDAFRQRGNALLEFLLRP